ncbi:MAG: hypothetical protein IJ326_05460 [Lachnospiraceae bacterium]|nr:hypothetical protein [Lachnospiraceae bacterium]
MRRIDAMVTMRNATKPTGKKLAMSCIVLMISAMIPSGMVSAASADLQEKWIVANETEEEISVSNLEDKSVEQHGTDDDGVVEVEMSTQSNVSSSGNASHINIIEEIEASKRITCPQHYMTKGDTIIVMSACDDTSLLYRIGIKNCDTGEMIYLQGNGHVANSFVISKAGKYAAYIQNCSTDTMEVMGAVMY